MGHDEDRGRIALADLVVQPCLQVIGKRLNTGLGTAAVRIVILVQDVDSVAVEVMTAGGVNVFVLVVMVTLCQDGVIKIQVVYLL